MPSAVLLNAYGSFELEGFSFTPKKPVRVSILSVNEIATLKGFFGTIESKPMGKYCSLMASTTSLSKPCAAQEIR